MGRQTAADKALDYIRSGRVTVTSANQHGIRLAVVGSRLEPYHVAYGRDTSGALVTICDCENSLHHPVRPTCAHIAAAKLLWRD